MTFFFSGGNLEMSSKLGKCGQKMSKFWLNLWVGKCSIVNKVACEDNWMLIFAMQMGFIISDNISERHTKWYNFGQNMSSQNSKIYSNSALHSSTLIWKNLLIICQMLDSIEIIWNSRKIFWVWTHFGQNLRRKMSNIDKFPFRAKLTRIWLKFIKMMNFIENFTKAWYIRGKVM